MNENTALEALRAMVLRAKHNDNPVPADLPTSYLVIEVADNEDNTGMYVNTLVIDPDMKEEGGAEEYLALAPRQRTIIELGDVVTAAATDVGGVVAVGPLEQDLWDKCNGNAKKLAALIRFLARKAAMMAVGESLVKMNPKQALSMALGMAMEREKEEESFTTSKEVKLQ